jgi:hypothetical protein
MATKPRRRAWVFIIATVVIVAMASVIVVPDVRVKAVRTLFPGVCMTEKLKTIPDLSDMNFEIIYTNCDTLAKEDSVSICVSRALGKEASFFERWFNKKTLIFKYVPGRSDTPSIKVSDNGRILISIPNISSIYVQSREWRHVSIEYAIGHVEYP